MKPVFLLVVGASALLGRPQLHLTPGIASWRSALRSERHPTEGCRSHQKVCRLSSTSSIRLAAAPVEPEIPVAAGEVQTDLTEEQRAALQAFAEIDADGDGELTADEIFRALSKNDADVTLERVHEIVEKADTDGNGTVNQQEYLNAVAVGIHLGKCGDCGALFL